jgi:hypothetical protein
LGLIGDINGSGMNDPTVESLSIRPDEFNRFLKTPSSRANAFVFAEAKRQRVSLENRMTV